MIEDLNRLRPMLDELGNELGVTDAFSSRMQEGRCTMETHLAGGYLCGKVRFKALQAATVRRALAAPPSVRFSGAAQRDRCVARVAPLGDTNTRRLNCAH